MLTSSSNSKYKAKSGMTLIEVSVALPIVLVALGMFLQMLTAGLGVRNSSSETWAASCAAQDVLERMRNTEFRDLFQQFNADPMDDIAGPGTAHGHLFAAVGLKAAKPDENEFVGEVVLPFVNAGTNVAPMWQVREDHVNADLGLPRDLNSDNLVDSLNHVADFSVLPILIRVRWQGRWGPRTFTLSTVLSEVQ
jgi:prepilin-type N-terminal cleavage/methylation domain-containing protein